MSIQSGSTASAATVHASNQSSVPWQVHWKNPTWTEYSTPSSLPSTSSAETPLKGDVVGLTSAQVLGSEIATNTPDIWKSFDPLPQEEDEILLTVTLLDPSNGSLATPRVATEVSLEWMHCDTRQILFTRRLLWPETMSSSSKYKKDTRKFWTRLGEIVMPWMTLNEEENPTLASDAGVLSATICRQPLTQQAKKEEALEVISSMVVGLEPPISNMDDGKEQELIYQGGTRSQDVATAPSTQQRPSEVEASIEQTAGPLCLACLSSHGLICIYSVWDLFSIGRPTSEAKLQASDEEKAVATWLLGADLFQHLESTWLPLSQPTTTIGLSILNEKTQNFGGRGDQSKPPDQATVETPSDIKSEVPPKPTSSISPNLFAWNPWIEVSTLRLRTVCNQATSIQIPGPSSTFLVVLGQGIPHLSNLRAMKSEHMTAVSEPLQIKEKTATAELEEHAGLLESTSAKSQDKGEGKDGDWWTQTGLPTTDASDQGNIDDDDGQGDWWADEVSDTRVHEKPIATNLSTETTIVKEDPPLMGGFITLCSMASWTEYRTFFLDFVPRFTTHVEHWHGMELLLCVGDERAVAIRLDSSSPVLIGEDDLETRPFHGATGINHSFRQTNLVPTVQVNRFHVVPLELPQLVDPDTKTKQRFLCAGSTTPPSVLQLHTELEPHSLQERGLLVLLQLAGISENGFITFATRETGRVAELPNCEDAETTPGAMLRSAWGYLGQGWSLVGAQDRVYFLCWEGATSGSGVSFLRELPGSPHTINAPCCVATVLKSPLPKLPVESYKELMPLSSSSYTIPSNDQIDEEDFESGNLVEDAIQSITSIRVASATDASLSAQEDQINLPPLSHRQKSQRLLRHLSSWTQLEDNEENRVLLDRCTPVIAIKTMGQSPVHILLMRKVAIENGRASPFSQVLGWLSQKHDYFTAASIALDLLRDAETLYHLWQHAERIDEEGEQTRLIGLLDGILPVHSLDREPHGSPTSTTATWTQLADMTVGCLVKGGLSMSKTLLKFLKSNQNYDPSRALLMLVAAAANTVSDDPDAVASAMGQLDNTAHSGQSFTIHELLWPVECLLEIGVSRDKLKMALDLLNATIPNELRRLPCNSSATLPPLELTRKIVTQIISCHGSATRLLLDLSDECQSLTYWQSLDNKTQQELALIRVRHTYPMLFHEEVRSWALSLLQGLLNENESGVVTVQWLRDLATACLFNAGCDLQDFILDPSNMSMMSISSENSSVWADLEMDGEDGLFQHKLEIIETRNALEPAPGSGGLDFDLLISCLLLLASRQAAWRTEDERFVSTQALLDAVCYLAGRPSSVEPRFALDAKSLMQLCAVTGNVRAGANLIGGRNGFVLSCCDILMLELQTSIEDAETFFLSERLDTDHIITTESSKFQQHVFELTDSHRQLLWLLDEHVLNIRTYGEFEANYKTRGRVDPVFAARLILRAWLCLTFFCKQQGSDWITRWLARRLGLQNEESCRHRLASAAIVRALLWPGERQEITDSAAYSDHLLGRVLEMDKLFLIQLARSACGLVESVPSDIAEGLIGLTEATQELSSSLVSTKMATSRTF